MWVAWTDVLFKVEDVLLIHCSNGMFWQRATLLHFCLYLCRPSLPPYLSVFPPVLRLAHRHIEKLRMWLITHLSPRVSHCRSRDGKGRDLLGLWTLSPWLTPALITIHHRERAYSQAYGFARAALSWMVKWIIRPRHIGVLVINMHDADWKNHTDFAV